MDDKNKQTEDFFGDDFDIEGLLARYESAGIEDDAADQNADAKFKVHIEGLDEEIHDLPKKGAHGKKKAKGQTAADLKAISSALKRKLGAGKRGAQGENGKTAKINLEPLFRHMQENTRAWAIVGICLLCAIAISTYTISCANDILGIGRNKEKVVTVTIPANTSTASAIDILEDNGLVKHKIVCKVFAKLMKYRDDNYLPGIYYVNASVGVEKMLSSFKESSNHGETVKLTFPEGYSIDQIAEKLQKYEVCSTDIFYKTLEDVDFASEYKFIASIQNKEARYHAYEGYFYPDTYEFYIGENASSVIRKFFDNFKDKWAQVYEDQAQKLGMSVDEVITIASIIEKEAYGSKQMPLVSSVLHNRLNSPALFPLLQCDSTVNYYKKYAEPHVTDTARRLTLSQSYNTSASQGLPPGAICNPGDSAIHAALFPDKSEYYFFLHDNNHKIYVAKTDTEHQKNWMAALKANQASSNT